MLLHNSVHCVGQQLILSLHYPVGSQTERWVQRFSAVPSWYNFGFPASILIPSWLQCLTEAGLCRILGSSLPIFVLNLTNFQSSLLASSINSQTEASYRAQFMNPEVGMLFCLFIKQTLLNIISVQHGGAGFWLMAWNWQNHFEICRFYCKTYLNSCLYPSNM